MLQWINHYSHESAFDWTARSYPRLVESIYINTNAIYGCINAQYKLGIIIKKNLKYSFFAEYDFILSTNDLLKKM